MEMLTFITVTTSLKMIITILVILMITPDIHFERSWFGCIVECIMLNLKPLCQSLYQMYRVYNPAFHLKDVSYLLFLTDYYLL